MRAKARAAAIARALAARTTGYCRGDTYTGPRRGQNISPAVAITRHAISAHRSSRSISVSKENSKSQQQGRPRSAQRCLCARPRRGSPQAPQRSAGCGRSRQTGLKSFLHQDDVVLLLRVHGLDLHRYRLADEIRQHRERLRFVFEKQIDHLLRGQYAEFLVSSNRRDSRNISRRISAHRARCFNLTAPSGTSGKARTRCAPAIRAYAYASFRPDQAA